MKCDAFIVPVLAALLGACAARPNALPQVPQIVTQLVPVPVACAASADGAAWRTAQAAVAQGVGQPMEVQVPMFRSALAAARAFIDGELAPAAKACGVTVR